MTAKTASAVVLLFLAMGSFAQSVATQSPSINVVTSAVPFLRITPDARSGAMGDLGVATSPDANSQYYNPAKYPFAAGRGGVALNFTPWLKQLGLNDVYLGGVSGYYKLDEEQALSGSLRYFSLGDVHLTDRNGMDLMTVNPYEYSVDAGYSRKLSQRLSMGVALRYIHSNLTGNRSINGVAYKPGNSVAGDLGLFYTTSPDQGSGWNIGMALTNLGARIGYTTDLNNRSFIPANFALGVNYSKTFQEVHKVSLGMDVRKLLVPTPPDMADSAAVEKYRRGSVVSSWFSSWSDAPGGFNEELQEFTASVVIARCLETPAGGLRWKIRIDQGLRPDITIAVRLEPGNVEVRDYYLLPWIEYGSDPSLRLAPDNGILLDTFRFDTLEAFYDLAKRTELAAA